MRMLFGLAGLLIAARIATWPTTEGLGMTDRTESILHEIKNRRSVLEL